MSFSCSLGTVAFFLWFSASAHLCQVFLFATFFACLVSVPTLNSFVGQASAAPALLIRLCIANVHRLWWLLMIAMPSVLSTSDGSQALAGHVVPVRCLSIAQLLVISATLVEVLKPFRPICALRLRTVSRSANCTGTLP